jgi:hypothetical protein
MQLRYRSHSSTEKVKGKLHTRIQTQDTTELSIRRRPGRRVSCSSGAAWRRKWR